MPCQTLTSLPIFSGVLLLLRDLSQIPPCSSHTAFFSRDRSQKVSHATLASIYRQTIQHFVTKNHHLLKRDMPKLCSRYRQHCFSPFACFMIGRMEPKGIASLPRPVPLQQDQMQGPFTASKIGGNQLEDMRSEPIM